MLSRGAIPAPCIHFAHHFHRPYAIATGNAELQGSINSTLYMCVCVFKRTKLREETDDHLQVYPLHF